MTAGDGVEKLQVGRVHDVLLNLQPVAWIEVLHQRDHAAPWLVIGVQDGEGRLLFWWPHVDKDHPLVLMSRVGPMTQPVFQRAIGRLPPCVQNPSIDFDEPGVIAAPYPLLLDEAELQRGAAVGTVELQASHLTALVTEHDQVLAENAHAPWQLLQVFGERHWLPEAAQILPARGARAHVGKLLVLLGDVTMVIGSVWLCQKGCPCRHGVSPPLAGSRSPTRRLVTGQAIRSRL